MDINLVGVLHNDPRGYDTTMRALEELEPDVVGVEWAGEEYDEWKQSEGIVELQEATDAAILEVLEEFRIDPEQYEKANKYNAKISGGEVRAVREFAKARGIPLVPTESFDQKQASNLKSLRDIEGACENFRQWLMWIIQEGKSYYKEATKMNSREYGLLEAHINGGMKSEDVAQWLMDGYLSTGVITDERVAYQLKKMEEARGLVPDGGNLVHVGGLAHLLDDDYLYRAGPVTLYQYLRRDLGDCIFRMSLRDFSSRAFYQQAPSYF